MKEVIIEVKEDKYHFFMELLENFDFVSIKNSSKKEVLLNIARGMKEAVLAEKGKVKSRSAKAFLNEL